MSAKRNPLIVQVPDKSSMYRDRLRILWEQLISQNPTNKDLLEVIHTMESLASAAYDELLKRNPPNEVLVKCLFCKDKTVCVKVGKLLLLPTSDPTNSNLAQLVNWGVGDTADKAWQELLRRNQQSAVGNETFREIIESSCHNVAEHRDKHQFRCFAAKWLLAQSPSKPDLVCVMEHCGEKLAREAINLFVGQTPTNIELCEVLEKIKDDYVVKRAMAVLLKSTQSNDELVAIITTTRRSNCYKFQEEALRRLLQNNPTIAQLEKIILRADQQFTDQAWQKFLQANPHEDELVKMMCSAAYRATEAAEQILRNNAQPSRQTLREIVELASEKYKEQAARLLLGKSKVSEEDLWLIHEHVSSLRDEVQKRLPKKSVAEIIKEMRRL